MSISALENLTDREASSLLARAIISTLPDPLAEGDSRSDPAVASLIADVRAFLKIVDGDNSQKSITGIRSELSRRLSERVLDADSKRAAINRASAAGRLGAASYQIGFSSKFDEVFRPLGARRSTVEKAIKDADIFCHIVASGSDENTDPVLSLYVKRMPAKGILPNHHILIQAGRHGSKLTVDAAWFIYGAPISSKSPIDFLKILTDKFGEVVELGGHSGRLIFDQPYLIPFDDEPEDTMKFLSLRGERGWGISRISWNRERKDATVQIAYAIDTHGYQEYLKRLGAI